MPILARDGARGQAWTFPGLKASVSMEESARLGKAARIPLFDYPTMTLTQGWVMCPKKGNPWV